MAIWSYHEYNDDVSKHEHIKKSSKDLFGIIIYDLSVKLKGITLTKSRT